MSVQTTLKVSSSVTSSQVSAFGRLLSGKRGSQTIEKSGLVAALANLSPRMAREKGLLTSGICGQPGTTLSLAEDLSASMASKLQARTDCLGSTLYKLTWKRRTTPLGQSIFALRASAHRMSANGCTSWPTPTARDYKDGFTCLNVDLKGILGRVVWLLNWDIAELPQSWKREGGAAQLTPERRTASGRKLTGSAAKITGGGQLSPEHSRWLMGIPKEWSKYKPTGTP